MNAIERQVAFRQRVFAKYPTAEDRRKHEVFIPRLKMPATWLNGGRWMDTVPTLEPDDPIRKKAAPICDTDGCESDSSVVVSDVNYCGWHWTRQFNRPHLRLLADKLNEIGLARKENESSEAWGDRCREYLRGSKWGNVLKA